MSSGKIGAGAVSRRGGGAAAAGEGTVTIGVSFDVPTDLAERVTEARRAAGDPLASVVRPHVTLLPPTPVRSNALVNILDHLHRVFSRTAGFEVVLRGADTFRPISPVVYLPLVQGARRCSKLAADVRSGPLDVHLAFPYHPHVTVAQNVPDAALDDAAARFAGLEERFRITRARVDVLGEDGTWTQHSAFELSAGATTGRRGLRRRSRRRR